MSKNKNMVVDPDSKGLITTAYPHLDVIFKSRITDEGELIGLAGEELDKAIRILAYCYDPNSPLIAQYPDLIKRKERACQMITLDYKKIPSLYVVLFLQKVIKVREWTLIMSMEGSFDELTEIINEPIKKDVADKDILTAVEKKSKLRVEMSAIIDEINARKSKFFFNDEDLIKEEAVGLRPEDYAKLTKKAS